jgi:hypothetical protein
MIVPGPARGIIDLELDRAAQAAARDRFCGRNGFSLRRHRFYVI